MCGPHLAPVRPVHPARPCQHVIMTQHVSMLACYHDPASLPAQILLWVPGTGQPRVPEASPGPLVHLTPGVALLGPGRLTGLVTQNIPGASVEMMTRIIEIPFFTLLHNENITEWIAVLCIGHWDLLAVGKVEYLPDIGVGLRDVTTS